MRIKSIECFAHDMKLSEPYTIAYETIDRCTNIFIKLHADSGLIGYGCAAPDFEVTGETGESVLAVYNNHIYPLLKGADPFTYALLLEKLKKALPNSSSAMAMADMALFDLISKQAGVPLYKYLGGYRKSIITSITIGIMPLDETLEKAADFVAQGFKAIKLKGGLNVDEDIEKITKTRERIGKKIGIRFDANQGYTVEEAVKFVKQTLGAKVELLEQPTPQKETEQLGMVSKRVSIPVMADESLKSMSDVFKLTRRDLTDMINIKLMKVGGINEALHINSVAKAAGVEVMVGCMDESAMAISAGLHFALAKPNVIYADLDGHLDLIGDPTTSSLILKNGVLYPKDDAGLGFGGF